MERVSILAAKETELEQIKTLRSHGISRSIGDRGTEAESTTGFSIILIFIGKRGKRSREQEWPEAIIIGFASAAQATDNISLSSVVL